MARLGRIARRLEHDWLWPLGFAITLGISTLLAHALIDEIESDQAAIMRSARVERELQEMLQWTVDVETGTRGYLLTRDPVFLEPAMRALPRIDGGLERMRTLTGESPAIRAALANLDATVARRLAAARAAQDAARRGLGVDAEAMLRSKELQDHIRAVVTQIGAQERAVRQRATQHSEQMRMALKGAIVLSMLVLGGFGALWLRARRRLLRTQDNYRHLFANAANGMALIGADGRIVQANASYAHMLGFDAQELPGMEFALLAHPADAREARSALMDLLAAEEGVRRSERRYLRRDGAQVWVRSTLSRMREARDGTPRVLVVAEDISERIASEEMLRRSAVLLGNAGRMAAIDGWFLELPGGTLQLGAQLRAALALDDDRPGAVLALLGTHSRRALLRAVARCRRRGLPFDVELEAGDAARTVTLRVMGQWAAGSHGLAGIEGAVQDISEQKRTQRNLLKSERRFRAAAQVTNDGIWDWDVVSGAFWRSPSIAAMLGLHPQALGSSTQAWDGLVHPEDRELVRQRLALVLEGGQDEFEAEYRIRRADGRYAWVLDKARALRDDDGAVVRLVGGIRDLTERRRSQQALMGMAASVPNGDSEAFFLTLLTHLLEAVGAEGGAVARRDEDDPGQMRTVAAISDGRPLAELRYPLAGSACARLGPAGEYIVAEGLATACPDARAWPGVEARAYAGRSLLAADGRALGVIFALFREPIADPDGVAAVLRVFAARAGAELERMDGAARMREQAALLDLAREAIVVLGLDLTVRFWSRGAQALYGIPAARARGTSVLSCYTDEAAARAALAAVLERGEWRGDSGQRRADGGELTVDESWTLVRDARGAPQAILKVGSDVTEKRAAEEQIRRLAYYDTLTGLPNRRLLLDRLRQLMLRNERQQRHGALLFIDMDNFKTLNDRHGHDAGDEFLRQTAARLRACVRADDTVARLGGDEFVILLDSLDTQAGVAIQQARAIGASVVAAFRQPVQIGAIAHRSTASVGIVLVRGGQDEVDELLRQADQAMYQAKHGGRNAVVVAGEAVADGAAATADELVRALHAGEFALWLQAEVDAGGHATGAFASLRWQRGPAGAEDFAALAQRCGVMPAIEDWMLDGCARLLAQWQRTPERAGHRLGFAPTAQQMRDPGFGRRVLDALERHGCHGAGLGLELGTVALDADGARANLALLRGAGVLVRSTDIALDKASLSGLPAVDGLRLDACLVRACADSAVDGAATRALLGLAHELGLQVVADGVETPAQEAVLRAAGCQRLRGPLYGAGAAQYDTSGSEVAHASGPLLAQAS